MRYALGDLKKGLTKITILLAGVAVTGNAGAQSADRAGTWETRLAVTFENSTDWDFEGGTQAAIEDDIGWVLGFGYHLNDNLEVGGTFEFGQQDYVADIANGVLPGVVFSVDGELETLRLMIDGTYNFLPGKFSPFISGAVGWSWIDFVWHLFIAL